MADTADTLTALHRALLHTGGAWTSALRMAYPDAGSYQKGLAQFLVDLGEAVAALRAADQGAG